MGTSEDILQLPCGFNPLVLASPDMTCGQIRKNRKELKRAALNKGFNLRDIEWGLNLLSDPHDRAEHLWNKYGSKTGLSKEKYLRPYGRELSLDDDDGNFSIPDAPREQFYETDFSGGHKITYGTGGAKPQLEDQPHPKGRQPQVMTLERERRDIILEVAPAPTPLTEADEQRKRLERVIATYGARKRQTGPLIDFNALMGGQQETAPLEQSVEDGQPSIFEGVKGAIGAFKQLLGDFRAAGSQQEVIEVVIPTHENIQPVGTAAVEILPVEPSEMPKIGVSAPAPLRVEQAIKNEVPVTVESASEVKVIPEVSRGEAIRVEVKSEARPSVVTTGKTSAEVVYKQPPVINVVLRGASVQAPVKQVDSQPKTPILEHPRQEVVVTAVGQEKRVIYGSSGGKPLIVVEQKKPAPRVEAAKRERQVTFVPHTEVHFGGAAHNGERVSLMKVETGLSHEDLVRVRRSLDKLTPQGHWRMAIIPFVFSIRVYNVYSPFWHVIIPVSISSRRYINPFMKFIGNCLPIVTGYWDNNG